MKKRHAGLVPGGGTASPRGSSHLPVPTDAELAKIRGRAQKPTVASSPRSAGLRLCQRDMFTRFLTARRRSESSRRKPARSGVECRTIRYVRTLKPTASTPCFQQHEQRATRPAISTAWRAEGGRPQRCESKESRGIIRNGKGMSPCAALAIFAEWEAWGDIIGGRLTIILNKEVTVRPEPGHPPGVHGGGVPGA